MNNETQINANYRRSELDLCDIFALICVFMMAEFTCGVIFLPVHNTGSLSIMFAGISRRSLPFA